MEQLIQLNLSQIYVLYQVVGSGMGTSIVKVDQVDIYGDCGIALLSAFPQQHQHAPTAIQYMTLNVVVNAIQDVLLFTMLLCWVHKFGPNI